ncbi:hypothetical protein H257_07517 [Aphanomyces astaci]|uniref:Uncharacterized protein n=1 Tax=Aphanomyces astaci TaxID=112090 RepID=W4GKV8_APHAT|nr:hypothetical protein H257_07517 [Aphanomyces astaci]ETV79533.1 hypothetical protein H257_07517 [Aphanomyces astaci]|eukprot:XP_009831374.1 hypothetical protein H257_07517 [Aphanomyces astaci]
MSHANIARLIIAKRFVAAISVSNSSPSSLSMISSASQASRSSSLTILYAAARGSKDNKEHGELGAVYPRRENDCHSQWSATLQTKSSRHHHKPFSSTLYTVLSVQAVERFGELVSDLDEGRLGLLAATGFATRYAMTVAEAFRQTQYALVAGAMYFPGKIRHRFREAFGATAWAQLHTLLVAVEGKYVILLVDPRPNGATWDVKKFRDVVYVAGLYELEHL